jgi:hypothetical protein
MMAQSALPEAQQILIIALDHHRTAIDAIENREGARAESILQVLRDAICGWLCVTVPILTCCRAWR